MAVAAEQPLGGLAAEDRPKAAISRATLLLFLLLCCTQCNLLYHPRATQTTFLYIFADAATDNAFEIDNNASTPAATELAESPYASILTEIAALDHLHSHGANRIVEQRDLHAAIGKSWWKLSEQLIIKSQSQGKDFSSTVRSAISDISAHCEELTRLVDRNRNEEVTLVSPAFQWAQSETRLFLNIKFTYRWSSPGALFVENEQFVSEDNRFFFTGVGSHSGIKKKYTLDLQLFKDIVPSKTQWSFASVGKAYVELIKAKPGMWKFLIQPEQKIPNMQIWWDMQEKYPVEEVEDTSVTNIGYPTENNDSTPKKKKRRKRKHKRGQSKTGKADTGVTDADITDAEITDTEIADLENVNVGTDDFRQELDGNLLEDATVGVKAALGSSEILGNIASGEGSVLGEGNLKQNDVTQHDEF